MHFVFHVRFAVLIITLFNEPIRRIDARAVILLRQKRIHQRNAKDVAVLVERGICTIYTRSNGHATPAAVFVQLDEACPRVAHITYPRFQEPVKIDTVRPIVRKYLTMHVAAVKVHPFALYEVYSRLFKRVPDFEIHAAVEIVIRYRCSRRYARTNNPRHIVQIIRVKPRVIIRKVYEVRQRLSPFLI